MHKVLILSETAKTNFTGQRNIHVYKIHQGVLRVELLSKKTFHGRMYPIIIMGFRIRKLIIINNEINAVSE